MRLTTYALCAKPGAVSGLTDRAQLRAGGTGPTTQTLYVLLMEPVARRAARHLERLVRRLLVAGVDSSHVPRPLLSFFFFLPFFGPAVRRVEEVFFVFVRERAEEGDLLDLRLFDAFFFFFEVVGLTKWGAPSTSNHSKPCEMPQRTSSDVAASTSPFSMHFSGMFSGMRSS